MQYGAIAGRPGPNSPDLVPTRILGRIERPGYHVRLFVISCPRLVLANQPETDFWIRFLTFHVDHLGSK